jgi:uncharacterized protein
VALRVRIPSWVAGRAQAWLNGTRLEKPSAPGSWLVIERDWEAGDSLEVSLPMQFSLNPTPDNPAVQAVMYGPVVLSGAYGERGATAMPRLDTESLALTSQKPLMFSATTRGASKRGAAAAHEPVTLLPIARMQHQHYNVYWIT